VADGEFPPFFVEDDDADPGDKAAFEVDDEDDEDFFFFFFLPSVAGGGIFAVSIHERRDGAAHYLSGASFSMSVVPAMNIETYEEGEEEEEGGEIER
jgi:hypothetical protein